MDAAPGPPIRARASLAASLAVAAAVAGAPGCVVLSNTRMEELRRVTQNLRAENGRLKDEALSLRSQNQDLVQRADDDGRRIAGLEEAVARLERSTSAYQAEREAMASAFEAIKDQVAAATTGAAPSPAARPSASRPANLEAFASSHPGWLFDAPARCLSAPVETLFSAGSDRLTPDAAESLQALASAISGAKAADSIVEIAVAAPAAPEVVRAGFEAGTPDVAEASSRFLAAARGTRVREALIRAAGLDPDRVRLVPPGDGETTGPRVEVRVKPRPADSSPARTGKG
jgi:chemotaxis protein MotB